MYKKNNKHFPELQFYNLQLCLSLMIMAIFQPCNALRLQTNEKCTPLRSYIPRAVNVGAELNVYGNVS